MVNNAGAYRRADNHKRGLSPGAISVCAYCAEISILDAERKARELTPDELAALKASPNWALVERYRARLRYR
jgi:hypothetical protein